MSSVGLDDWDDMALIGQRRVLSTALPRNKNLPHTCWMNQLALSSKGVPSILALHIVSLNHIGLVHSDMVHAVVCLLCVGIALKLSAHSLALLGEPGVCCSPNTMLSQ